MVSCFDALPPKQRLVHTELDVRTHITTPRERRDQIPTTLLVANWIYKRQTRAHTLLVGHCVKLCIDIMRLIHEVKQRCSAIHI